MFFRFENHNEHMFFGFGNHNEHKYVINLFLFKFSFIRFENQYLKFMLLQFMFWLL